MLGEDSHIMNVSTLFEPRLLNCCVSCLGYTIRSAPTTSEKAGEG